MNKNLGKWAYGGMETHAEILSSLLIGRGHDVIIGCSVNGTVTMKTRDVALPATKISIANSVDIFGLITLIRFVKKEHIDVILVNHGKDYWPAAIAAYIADTPVIFIRHMCTRLKQGTCRMINRLVDRVIAVSNDVRKRLISSGLSSEKIEVIYNGINLNAFNPAVVDYSAVRNEFGIKAHEQVVGFVGKLDKGKGVHEMLSAMKYLAGIYPLLKMIFAGEGPEHRRLEEDAKDSGLAGRVIFTGERKDITAIYAAMDICVLPSTEGEAFGLVLIEAMAMRKPVIGTMVGGISEIISHEVNGLLILPKDPDALAKAIRKYLDNPLFSEEMAQAGRLTVERLFTDDGMCDKYERLLHDVIAGRS